MMTLIFSSILVWHSSVAWAIDDTMDDARDNRISDGGHRLHAVNKDMTTIYVIGACLALLVYSLTRFQPLPPSRTSCSLEGESDRLGVDHQAQSDNHLLRMEEGSPSTSWPQGLFKDVSISHFLSKPNSRTSADYVRYASTLTSITIALKISSLVLLLLFEIVHVFVNEEGSTLSSNFTEFYRWIIGPALFFPVVFSDVMTHAFALMINVLTSSVTLIRKRLNPEDHYVNADKAMSAMIEKTSSDSTPSKKFSGHFFNPENDSLGLMYTLETGFRVIIAAGSWSLLTFELILFSCACFGAVAWEPVIHMTLLQVIIIGVICSVLKMACWSSLMAAMGFEVYLLSPFGYVHQYMNQSLTRGLLYVLFRIITYIGMKQMFDGYLYRLIQYPDSFVRVDGDSIIFFLVLDTASMMTAAIWQRINTKFILSVDHLCASRFESNRGISLTAAERFVSGSSGVTSELLKSLDFYGLAESRALFDETCDGNDNLNRTAISPVPPLYDSHLHVQRITIPLRTPADQTCSPPLSVASLLPRLLSCQADLPTPNHDSKTPSQSKSMTTSNPIPWPQRMESPDSGTLCARLPTICDKPECTTCLTLDSRAGRLISIECQHKRFDRRLIRRHVISNVSALGQGPNHCLVKLLGYYQALPSAARGLFNPVLDVTFGHSNDEIWMIYQCPGPGWYTPAYWLLESEHADEPQFTLALVIAITRALSDLDSTGVSHGHLDPNVSILVRPLLKSTVSSPSFDVIFLDWGLDLLKDLELTSFATRDEMRQFAETVTWMSKDVWCLPVKHNSPDSDNSGLRWAAPEYMIDLIRRRPQFQCLQSFITDSHDMEIDKQEWADDNDIQGCTSLTTRKEMHQSAPVQVQVACAGKRDSYFLGLFLWVLGVRLSNICAFNVSPYASLATDEEVIMRVAIGGSRPNISQLLDSSAFWGTDEFSSLLKSCLSRNPSRRPSASCTYQLLLMGMRRYPDMKERRNHQPDRDEIENRSKHSTEVTAPCREEASRLTSRSPLGLASSDIMGER